MKKPIFNLCNRLWDIVIPEDWKNQTDYPENTAKVFHACDVVDAMPVWEVADILGLDFEDEEEERLAARVKDEFLIGCDKWLAA